MFFLDLLDVPSKKVFFKYKVLNQMTQTVCHGGLRVCRFSNLTPHQRHQLVYYLVRLKTCGLLAPDDSQFETPDLNTLHISD